MQVISLLLIIYIKQIHIRNSHKIITLRLLLMYYYTRTALIIEVLFNYSGDNLYNIVNIVLISD